MAAAKADLSGLLLNSSVQDLAHTLLIEFLAHQFAYPVRCILESTQDVILKKQNVDRVVEIGPRSTLLNVVKRTMNRDPDAWDEYEKPHAEEPAESVNQDAIDAMPPITKLQLSLSVPDSPPSHSPNEVDVVAKIPDSPIHALDVIRTICSQKLKKTISNANTNDTIRVLAAGRSTLQNEIVGDLEKEFGSLPNSPEDLTLDKLGTATEPHISQGLGKITKSLIERMVSSKIPGNMTVSSIRNHLQMSWGFQRGRQDAILLHCVVHQPSVRITEEKEANSFLDSVVLKYASTNGLNLGRSPNRQSKTSKTHRLSHQQIQHITSRQKHIGFDLYAVARSRDHLHSTLDIQKRMLDMWDLEHGETYSTGVCAQFDPLKVREYDSSWAWGLQDVFELCHSLSGAPDANNIQTMSRQIHHIVNCSSRPILEVMKRNLVRSGMEHENSKALNAPTQPIEQRIRETSSCEPIAKITSPFTRPTTGIDDRGKVIYNEVPRCNATTSAAWAINLLDRSSISIYVHGRPYQKIESQDIARELIGAHFNSYRQPRRKVWNFDPDLTYRYSQSLSRGIPLKGRQVLLTGAGKGSIGEEVLKGLLSGGAHVVVGTSSFSFETATRLQKIYMDFGATNARLILAPFNQGSRQDIEALVNYIYNLGWDLDHIIPFATLSDNGHEIDEIDSGSELAHRVMLTNVIRILGAVKRQKEARGSYSRPAQVILPLSGNHGQFGSDGLYAESKIALETLFNKWSSERWSSYLSLCGAIIGWTRGTRLMNSNNIVAEDIEKLGARTFSRQEMAFLILALLTGDVRSRSEDQPILADLNGRLDEIEDLDYVLRNIRDSIQHTCDVRKAIRLDAEHDALVIDVRGADVPVQIEPKPGVNLPFPTLPDLTEIAPLTIQLHGMVDLSRVVVIAGYAEVNPFGNARTRWDIEACGKFSVSGCIELALMMGLIKHFDGLLNSTPYSGWIDSKSKQPVTDADIQLRYEKVVMENTGIRLVCRADGGPLEQETLHEVIIQDNMPPVELPKTVADDIKRHHGAAVEVVELEGSESYTVRFKKGATLLLPKSAKIKPRVAGQIPNHWDTRNFGISEDVISQVDPGTLYVLVCAAETLIAAGITDPYELYRYIHVSKFGTCIGSGLGGTEALEKIFKHRYLDKDVQNDILQETFINTAGACVNLLLLSSSGPNRTPVGACATSLESLGTGYENIVSYKAKACLVGGFDTMQAIDDLARGRVAKEMSRPTTSTRCGFVESEGCGMQLITSASLALEMGLPIHGIVALVEGASDKIGRSIPAPGRGIMSNVQETTWLRQPQMLDLKYRRRLRDIRLRQIQESLQLGFEYAEESTQTVHREKNDSQDYQHELRQEVLREAEKQKRDVLHALGNEFWKEDSRISPIRGALATWGLTVDDLGVASLHGTSTKANDENEVGVLHEQLRKLGREAGNPILAVCQKSLTGHPKGAAGAWMVNGCLQTMDSGFVPGNANADNIDASLEEYSNVAFLNRGLQTTGIKACSVTTFGFGQKGYQAILVHPKYLFATLDEKTYQEYETKTIDRRRKAKAHFSNSIATNSLF
ncbi:thiolase-like protein [Melanomma pulvis-pyrius CBS 109.77]|uniref:beta-ketoacyl-[acyl-carrier-protein] synthase I n=1 Tax=Melanomma pulvis-pyrius CBS 109.77 TaxID=1314802 RepID=A0A6A6XXH2_9PLEO|nr:thiolase-like protein [Melanomma pulvis-pyrius CBS 109.77]